MQYSIITKDACAEVTLSGEIYTEDIGDLRKALQQLEADQIYRYVVDMSQVTFIDSGGLGMLISLQKIAARFGEKVTVKGLQGSPLEIFKFSRLTQLFHLV